MNERNLSQFSIPAVFIAFLALLGIVNSPGGASRGGRSAEAGGGEVSGQAEAAARSRNRSADVESLLRPYKLTEEQKAANQLAILAPLAEFYAPRLGQVFKDHPNPTSKAVVEQLLSGVPGLSEHGSKHYGDQVEVLIGLTPDPDRSGSPYRFDDSITAIQLAMRRAGFFLDGHRVPWGADGEQRSSVLPRSRGEGTFRGPAGLELDLAWEHPASEPPLSLRQPGMMVFRKFPTSEDAKVNGDTSHELRLVLLVPHTPIRGVDPAVLTQALDLALQSWKLKVGNKREKCVRTNQAAIRISGPDFSGSPSSIARTLDAWVGGLEGEDKRNMIIRAKKGGYRPIEIISGVALAVENKPLLGSEAIDSPDTFYRYRMVVHNVWAYQKALLDYIRRGQRKPVKVAILTEETSGYGGVVSAGSAQEKPEQNGEQNTSQDEILYYTFPMHIAELRQRYRQAAETAAESGGRDLELRTLERLGFETFEGSGIPEQVQLRSPGTSSANNEMRLLRVARDIDRRGIGHVIVTATDMRDVMFVTEYMRTHCPNARLYSLDIRQAFTQQQRYTHFRGMVVAGTHPVLLPNQDWSTPDEELSAGNEVRALNQLALPEQAGHGAYNAMMAHLIELTNSEPGRANLVKGMLEYGSPHDKYAPTPPIWISVASQRGFFPLEIQDVRSDVMWRPPGQWRPTAPTPPTFDDVRTVGWTATFLVSSVILFLIALAYLSCYVRFFVFGGEPISKDPLGLIQLWERLRGERFREQQHVPEGWRFENRPQDPSWLLDYLGLKSIVRRDADSGGLRARRRRKIHSMFWVLALIGYLIVAAPAWLETRSWVLEKIWSTTTWVLIVPYVITWNNWSTTTWVLNVPYVITWITGVVALYVITWITGVVALVASFDVLIDGSRQRGIFQKVQRRDRPVCLSEKQGRRIHLVCWLTLGLVLALNSLVYVSTARWLLVAPSVDYSRDALIAKFFCLRATALASGVSPLLPIVLLLIALAFGTYFQLRKLWALRLFLEKSDGQKYSQHSPIHPRSSNDPQFEVSNEAMYYFSRDRLKEVAQGWFFFDMWKFAPLTWGIILAAAAAIGVFLVWEAFQDKIADFEAIWIRIVLVFGVFLLFTTVLAKAAHLGLLGKEIERATEAILDLPMTGAFDRLPKSVAHSFGSYIESIHGDSAGNPVVPPTHQQHINTLLRDLGRAEYGLLGTVSADVVSTLRTEVGKSELKRQGAKISRACVEVLLPFWKRRPTERAYPDPGSPGTQVAAAEFDELAGVPVDEHSNVRRLIEQAEEFVAMELLRDLNRPIMTFWVRVTSLTILSLLLLMVVSSYPFRPAGTLIGLALLVVVFAVGVMIRVLWGFQRNGIIRRVTNTDGRPGFNLEFLGRLITYVLPMALGLFALSFAASDVLRALLGSLLG